MIVTCMIIDDDFNLAIDNVREVIRCRLPYGTGEYQILNNNRDLFIHQLHKLGHLCSAIFLLTLNDTI